MSKFNTSSEYYAALSSKFDNGGYGKLKHPEMARWLANEETANGIIADTKALISCLSDDDKIEAARSAFRSFRSMIRDVIRYAEYPTIHDLPSVYTIMVIDDSYDTIEKIITGPIEEKENNDMNNINTFKEQMQENIDNCNNTISFEEFSAKAEAAEDKVKIKDGEEKIISSPRKNNIADICNIINIVSTAALIIKSCRTKKNTGKYRVSDLACITLSSYITGQSIRETYQHFPSSIFGRLYRNTAKFMKKIVETIKKVMIKTTRTEVINYEER